MPIDPNLAADAVDADEVLAVARSLLAARSENPGGTEDEAAAVAAGVLEGLGAAPEVVRGEAGRPSVVATIGDGDGPTLAWNGHLDTVPAGSLDTWTADPFAGEVVDGRLIGRGACDMKGPIAAALAAAAAVRRAGIDGPGRVTLPPGGRRGAGGHPRHPGAVGARALDAGRRDRRGAERPRGRACRARWRVDHGDRARDGGARVATRSRRERDHLDGALPAAPARGAARHRAPAVRPAHRQRRVDRAAAARPTSCPIAAPSTSIAACFPARTTGTRCWRRSWRSPRTSAASTRRSTCAQRSASGPTPPRRRRTRRSPTRSARPTRAERGQAPAGRRLHRDHRRALLHQRRARSRP